MKLRAFILCLCISSSAWAEDYNALVLQAVNQLPAGGRYSVSNESTVALSKAILFDQGALKHNPLAASPVFCSGASYQAFIEVVIGLQKKLRFTAEVLRGLLVALQDDGTDAWGRWNSNGPGTARLFYELGLGTNSMDWNDAQPGDFMKIYWNEHIGHLERAHSVVYLGTVVKNGEEYMRYWSSNSPDGRGVKETRKSRAVRVIFSRLTHLENLSRLPTIPKTDDYLASLLTHASTPEEMKKKIGL